MTVPEKIAFVISLLSLIIIASAIVNVCAYSVAMRFDGRKRRTSPKLRKENSPKTETPFKR